MDCFTEALLCGGVNQIPEEYDWFAPLIGDWDFIYRDGYDRPFPRQVEGEWLFRRVLNGMGIEDLFICPSRATLRSNPQPDGEYGMAIRLFDPVQKCYSVTYACETYNTNLRFTREGGKLVGTVVGAPESKWVFSDITESTFHWQNITVLENGDWNVNSDVYAKRKNG